MKFAFLAATLALGAVVALTSPAYSAAYGSVSPGGFTIVTGDGEVLGRQFAPTPEPFPTYRPAPHPQDPASTGVPTFRLQIERIERNPYAEWPCPRGVSVLRYGKRGC